MADETHLLRVEQIVRPMYDRLQLWAHAWPHVRRVAKNTKELAGIVGTDPIACQMAAYCHDIGRVVEEASGGKKTELGNVDHSLDSISPTVDVLREAGVEGYHFNSVIGAVVVHADKFYHGKNLVAKVLRDSDKRDSLGPWGTLRHVNHHYSHDLVDTAKIIESQDNPEEIRALADETLGLIKRDEKTKTHYLRVLDFVLEWVENRMLDTEQGYAFVQEDYDFTRKSKEFLTK